MSQPPLAVEPRGVLAAVGANPSPRRRPSAWTRLRDGVSTYLPLLLMVLLALATGWLVKHAPQPTVPTVERTLRHEADYLMGGAVLQRFDKAGQLRVQVNGAHMRHYPDTDTLEVDEVRIRLHGDDGSITHATARRAVTNHDASLVRLEGGATVQREATPSMQAVQFQSEFVQIDLKARTVKSHRPVTLRMGPNEIQAQAFEYNETTEVVQLQGAVRASLVPAQLRAAPAPKP